jgi:hypothetical protein
MMYVPLTWKYECIFLNPSTHDENDALHFARVLTLQLLLGGVVWQTMPSLSGLRCSLSLSHTHTACLITGGLPRLLLSRYSYRVIIVKVKVTLRPTIS